MNSPSDRIEPKIAPEQQVAAAYRCSRSDIATRQASRSSRDSRQLMWMLAGLLFVKVLFIIGYGTFLFRTTTNTTPDSVYDRTVMGVPIDTPHADE